MSESNIMQKLQMKPEQSMLLLNVPEEVMETLTYSLNQLALFTEPSTKCHGVFLFVTSCDELKRWVDTAVSAMEQNGKLWIAYPKKSSKIESDITRDHGWRPLTQQGWEGVRNIAINRTWSALRFRPSLSDEEMLAAQYGDKKVALVPIFDRLVALAHLLGDDLSVTVRKGYVAFKRKKQFALIKPTTKSRIDFALRLDPAPNDERLIANASVGSGSMTHVVSLTDLAQVDDDVQHWFEMAYEQAGKKLVKK